MNLRKANVLFCSKSGDANCESALKFLRENCDEITACMGGWGDEMPNEMLSWRGDYIISFMSKWIIPSSLLERAEIAAINFHPAPPARPGAACANFALYDGDTEYGATCHHMETKVDSGKIIKTKKFPILEDDDVESLLERTHDCLLKLFFDVMLVLIDGRPLPESAERWVRENFHTRKDLNEGLRKIPPDVSESELKRRIRATSFGDWKPYLEIHGVKFIMEQ